MTDAEQTDLNEEYAIELMRRHKADFTALQTAILSERTRIRKEVKERVKELTRAINECERKGHRMEAERQVVRELEAILSIIDRKEADNG